MLQAMKEDLPTNAKCKDKFLIQSTIITPEKESMSLQDIVRHHHVCVFGLCLRLMLRAVECGR